MEKQDPQILKGKSLKELEQFFAELGEPSYRARQAFRRINKHLARSPDEFTEFSLPLRAQLNSMQCMPELPVINRDRSADGTEKFVLDIGATRRGEARKVEAVWIVSEKRRTVCISSQVGCTLNCTFCATGTLPFLGNLQTWQIVEQVYQLIRERHEPVTNVVFMGMGEPFHNYDNVIRAAHILHHPDGLNLGARHITISTAGVIPSIERFIKEKEPFNLAISLNHPDVKQRSEIMDINKKFDLDQLLKVARRFTRELDRRITFEYVLIPDVNMHRDHLQKLIKIGKSVRCKINLIPLNTRLQGWRRPGEQEVAEFQSHLLDANLSVFNRGSPGLDINGACGMLALAEHNR
ncbi:MAG: 23S rRNA (adenine(2503)-C(2))-methyltransferase RlmN [Leptospiraceae bacterium]|nr:23S rRNA (adenine(2503)-C(2))-methyltransferase RlmN [Leptospiraceae bacterium]